jgi:hypothetical protein
MTPREGFKYGFLLRCAEEGLTADEAEARAARGLEKQAGGFDPLSIASDVAKAGWGLGKWTAGKALTWGVPLGLGAAALGGGGLGYGLAKLQEGDVDPEEIQREELISAYKTQADLARRKAIMDAAQRMRPRPKSYHGI